MNQSDPNIDELLNSFIDGELSSNERIEVQQLITRDAQIAKRLRDLQKIKMLVSSLPRAKAPAGIVKSALGRLEGASLWEEQPVYSEQEGVRPAVGGLLRTFLAAAAVIVLVAVFGGVIYTILAPQSMPVRNVTSVAVVEPLPGETSGAGFSGRLELNTGSLTAVDAFISRAVRDNELSDYVKKTVQTNKNLYSFSCSRQNLSILLSDLQGIWQRFDSAALFVDTEWFHKPVVIEAITAEQTAEIVKQDSPQKAIEVAKGFAVLNNMAELTPGKQILTAIDNRSVDLISPWRIPKPVLTGDQKTVKKTKSRPEDSQEVSLTIVVTGNE